jgi:uncharacterized protein YaiI (UPF0178 family)
MRERRVLTIFVDADACPVKPEVYRVAKRYGLKVLLVTNLEMRKPPEAWIEMIRVDGKFDAADDWIVEQAGADDIVISGDIPLAARCLAKGAHVLGNSGRPFTPDNIGSALASRQILSHLRDLGEITGGPRPFEKKDRSRFLQALDETIQTIRRRAPSRPDPAVSA